MTKSDAMLIGCQGAALSSAAAGLYSLVRYTAMYGVLYSMLLYSMLLCITHSDTFVSVWLHAQSSLLLP